MGIGSSDTGVLRTSADSLVGRDAEFAQVAASLEAAREGAGTALVVEGPAGIGKTRLLREAQRLGAEAGMQVLHGRGSPLEHEFAMGVVRQCFDPVVHGSADAALFTGAAARARETAQKEDRRVAGWRWLDPVPQRLYSAGGGACSTVSRPSASSSSGSTTSTPHRSTIWPDTKCDRRQTP